VPSVARLSVTPVKGLALHHPEELALDEGGVRGDRRFLLVDDTGRLFSITRHGPLSAVTASYDPDDERLRLRFPSGETVEGEAAASGNAVSVDMFGRPVSGRVVPGPFEVALSAYAGRPVKLLRLERDLVGFDLHPLTLVSRESVAELARRAGLPWVDPRRFRMTMDLAGCSGPHEEDAWAGRRVRVGEVVVEVLGPVPRCAATTRDPDTGKRDLDTLRLVRAYRGAARDDVCFGVYAAVREPGRVRVGDPVEPL
jgi:hypothetical protein